MWKKASKFVRTMFWDVHAQKKKKIRTLLKCPIRWHFPNYSSIDKLLLAIRKKKVGENGIEAHQQRNVLNHLFDIEFSDEFRFQICNRISNRRKITVDEITYPTNNNITLPPQKLWNRCESWIQYWLSQCQNWL